MASLSLYLDKTHPKKGENRTKIGRCSLVRHGDHLKRIEQYFADREYLKQPYIEGAKFLQSRSCLDIGLFSHDEDVFEYPLWMLLQEKNKLRIKHINVTNKSGIKSGTHPAENFTPCAIFVLKTEYGKPINKISTNHDNYQKEWSLDLVYILTKNSPRAD